jgi:hypothetical protein
MSQPIQRINRPRNLLVLISRVHKEECFCVFILRVAYAVFHISTKTVMTLEDLSGEVLDSGPQLRIWKPE